MDFISRFDPEVGASIRAEFDREVRNIELIASENIVSEAVMVMAGGRVLARDGALTFRPKFS